MKLSSEKILLNALILASVAAIVLLFGTRFAENTIDYTSFAVGIFLVAEAGYKIMTRSESFFPTQLFRLARVIFGTGIFTIHLLQFLDKF